MTAELAITADDRTGALEVAGICADAGLGPVLVESWPCRQASDGMHHGFAEVVDLASRHLSVGEAADRARRSAARGAVRAHKIDSTLRGRWADELVALTAQRSARCLLIPALPALGRVCRDGVVLVDGRPVQEVMTDARTPVLSSVPADHLRGAGASAAEAIADRVSLERWLIDGETFGVCDAGDDDEVEAIVRRWAEMADHIVLAGPSGPIAAGAAALADRRGVRRSDENDRCLPTPIDRPLVVVCGSLHPIARRQVEILRASAPSGVTIIASDVPSTATVSARSAIEAATELAERLAALPSPIATTVVLGGDTAARVLGDAPVTVHGTCAPGTPWMMRSDGGVVITRAGGFGDETALIDLVSGRMSR